jgi:subtilase family serine protease
MLAGAVVLVAPLAASAQGNAVRPRVTDRIDITRLATLSGNTHPLARAQYDQGAAPPDLPMDRIMLVLKRGPDQEAALQDLLVQQQVNSSPTYHKWLTPDQFGQQFGPADADIQAITSWLASFGFQSIKVSKGRTVIEFSGTAAQVEAGLHTSIHKYVVNGETHWANAGDPQIPVALAPVIAGFASLHNFPKKPASIRSGQMASLTKTPDGKPQITFTDNSHGVAPADFNTIYNIAPSMTGSGVTIGVIARSNILPQDVADFRSTFGLSGNNLNIILNGPDPGDLGMGEEVEAVLDATWTGAVAPGATVDLVVSESTNADPGEDLSEFYIVDNNLADVMTESFSVCETAFGTQLSAAASFYSSVAEQAAAQGITYLVASGDSGPDSCDDPNAVPATLQPASVNLLASTPFTVAVGGTEFFSDTATTNNPYWNTNNNPAPNLGSAKSYIPEKVWNESCTVAQCGAQLTGLWSSGGGQSIVPAFTKPPWQTGVVGIPAGNRSVPDVSMAAAGHDGYVLCIDASCQGSRPGFAIISGTSASAQVFGGVMALVVQKTGRVGIANYALYKLAATETLSSCNGSNVLPALPPITTCIFNDVTIGDTNIPEVGPKETGFKAGVGYDEATGLGSVNVSNLVNQWHTAIVNGSKTTLTLNGGNPVSVAHGAAVPVNVVVAPVAPATGAPTGDVSLVANSVTGQGADLFPLTPGTSSSTASWGTVFLPGGNYQVKAHYEGDGKFTGSDSNTVTVTVTQESSKTLLGVVVNPQTCATATSITYGSAYVLTAAVIDLAGSGPVCLPMPSGAFPTGTVHVTDNAANLDGVNGSGNFLLNSGGYFEDQTIQLPAGVHSIIAIYGGDNSFSGSTSATDTVTVAKATTTTAVSASQTTVASGTNVTLTATVSTQSNAIANASQEPNGTLQFFDNGSVFSSPVTVIGGVNSSTSLAQATAVISTSKLAAGAHVITAKYLGDKNYAASATSPSVKVTVTNTTPLKITTNSVPTNVDAGVAYSTTLTATGGVPPYTPWIVNSGALPTGLLLSNAGVISGTPIGSAVGTANFTVKVTDSQGTTATSGSLTIAVSGFNFTPASLGQITITSPGMSGTGLITLNVVNGFTGTATLTANVTGSPANAKDLPVLTFTTPDSNFSSANNTMTFSNAVTTGNVTLNVATTPATASLRLPIGPIGRALTLAAAAVSLLGIFFLLAVQKQRRWGFVPLTILLVVVAVAGVSCAGGSSGGGGGGGGGGNPGTTTGNYMITVVATPAPGGTQGAQTAIIPVTVN